MNAERPELRLIREKLESVLAPALVQSALFEALADIGGRPPKTADEVRSLLEGPLRRALAKRLEADDADELIKDIGEALKRAIGVHASACKPLPRVQDITLEITLGKGAVAVLVFSASEHLAACLQAVLGPQRVAARTCTTQEQMETMLGLAVPPILLVDAVEFPPVDAVVLAKVLSLAPRESVRAIWGADLAYGAVVLKEMAARNAAVTPFDRREGIDPLLDLIRSRRA